jgi:hypothetical protein
MEGVDLIEGKSRRSKFGRNSGIDKATVDTTAYTAREVTRDISPPIVALLWGRAAGRCEFEGCNRPLWKSSVTQESVNVAEKAHIYSFSAGGARGNAGVSSDELNSIDNLLLVCHDCHRTIDKEKDGGRYPVALLQRMKANHERRIETVTGIAADKKSHVLLYGANIGQHRSPLQFAKAASALFPVRYPAEERALALGTIGSPIEERSASFWQREVDNLQSLFERRVRDRLAAGEVDHLSVFALAPQPLLVLLGTLLGDIVPADVYQLHREPPGWAWPPPPPVPPFVVHEPDRISGPPALVLSLSATVTPDRIAAVLGPEVAIWMVSVGAPHNDVVKSREQLAHFRTLLRPLLDRIKAACGQAAPLHIFPASPVSLAVELGRVRMPKADMPWRIYDQVNELGGFVSALSIPTGA